MILASKCALNRHEAGRVNMMVSIRSILITFMVSMLLLSITACGNNKLTTTNNEHVEVSEVSSSPPSNQRSPSSHDAEQPRQQQTETFDENDAIAMVIKQHPDFPAHLGEMITRKLPMGGPAGTTANVTFMTTCQMSPALNVKAGATTRCTFTTATQPVSESTYIVTLTKDWHITVNDTPCISYWKYEVTANGAKLLKSPSEDLGAMIDSIR
jgi:hypothetical protein